MLMKRTHVERQKKNLKDYLINKCLNLACHEFNYWEQSLQNKLKQVVKARTVAGNKCLFALLKFIILVSQNGSKVGDNLCMKLG